jgi:hypothetical protein
MVDAAARRRMTVVLWVAVALIVAYWTAWYADRSSVASNQRSAYYEFENAFPLADAWLAFCCVAAAVCLRRARPAALLWLLMGAGAGLYLFGMDVLYDAEHGVWWRSGAGGVIEALINALSLVVSSWFARWAWARRDALLTRG